MGNQTLRKKALDVGSVVAKKELQGMTFRELKEAVLYNNDQNIFNKLQLYSRQLENSNQYFYYKHSEANALMEVKIKEMS